MVNAQRQSPAGMEGWLQMKSKIVLYHKKTRNTRGKVAAVSKHL